VLALKDDQHVVLCLKPTDMRKGFLSLASLVREAGFRLKQGTLFVFFSRNKSRVKILTWDDDGYALYYKKLEEDTFRISYTEEEPEHECITGVDLTKLLAGMSLKRIQLQKKVATGVLGV